MEATGETVGEAKWSALRELERLHPGLDKGAVRFQVVAEGERGLLGVGYAPARVIAALPAGEPPPRADESPLASRIRAFVDRVTQGIGVPCRIDLSEDEQTVTVSCSARELGMLIGKHGHTIDAIQYLVNAVVARSEGDSRKEVVIDAAGYRARRRASLETLALRSAERAAATGQPVELDPMTAVERKVVHLRLKSVEGVETLSEGAEPNRFVVIQPAGAAD